MHREGIFKRQRQMPKIKREFISDWSRVQGICVMIERRFQGTQSRRSALFPAQTCSFPPMVPAFFGQVYILCIMPRHHLFSLSSHLLPITPSHPSHPPNSYLQQWLTSAASVPAMSVRLLLFPCPVDQQTAATTPATRDTERATHAGSCLPIRCTHARVEDRPNGLSGIAASALMSARCQWRCFSCPLS